MALRPILHDETCFACSGGSDLHNRFWWDDVALEARSRTVFGPGCQGAPDFAHGGAVFTILDEVMGAACWMGGLKVMTGRASIHYRRPVPLRQPLQAVGRMIGVDGKKVKTYGELRDNSGIYATTEGTFILIERYVWPVHLGEEVDDET